MEGVDRISALPDEIILQILSFLTVDHVVPTSALSKRWRYLWTFNPKMRFPPCYNLFRNKPKCSVAVIDRCIKQYKGKHLQDLFVRLDVMEDESKVIQEWFDFAMDKKVQSLHLRTLIKFDFMDDEQKRWVKVHGSLFSLQSLQHLCLSCCELVPPLDIKCFDSLTHLSLQDVTLFDGALESLLSKCLRLQKLFLDISSESLNLCISLPHLQQLGIFFVSALHTVQICAPNLLLITLSGCVVDKLYLQNAPHLQKAVLFLQPNQGVSLIPHADLNFWGSTMHNITNLEVFNITYNVFKMMLMEYYSNGKSGLALNNLKEFLCLQFKNLFHPHSLVRFFIDCPSLVKLELQLSCSDVKFFINAKQLEADILDYERQLNSCSGDYTFDHLTHVEVSYVAADCMQLALIKFVLNKAKVLEELLLEFRAECKPYQDFLVNYMFTLPKLSPHATIKIIGANGKPVVYPMKDRRARHTTSVKAIGGGRAPINHSVENGCAGHVSSIRAPRTARYYLWADGSTSRPLWNYARYYLCCLLFAFHVILIHLF